MHEASLHAVNQFVTLTYEEEKLPQYGTLVRRDLQLFLKRLRKSREPSRIRFFGCGEYGERKGRPHYHALLFGCDFPDKVAVRTRAAGPVWESKELEGLWQRGRCEIGTVTKQSAGYVARYALKKVMGPKTREGYAGPLAEERWNTIEELRRARYEVVDLATGEVGQRSPEFLVMSRRPGIGAGWLERYGTDTYPRDGVVVDGALVKPPRYYDEKWSEVEGEAVEAARASRRRARKRSDETPVRLEVREAVQESRLTRLRRDVL